MVHVHVVHTGAPHNVAVQDATLFFLLHNYCCVGVSVVEVMDVSVPVVVSQSNPSKPHTAMLHASSHLPSFLHVANPFVIKYVQKKRQICGKSATVLDLHVTV